MCPLKRQLRISVNSRGFQPILARRAGLSYLWVGLAMTVKRTEKEDREDMAVKTSAPEAASADESDDNLDDDDGREAHPAKVGALSKPRMKLWIAIGLGVVVAVLLATKLGANSESGPPLAAAGTTVVGDLTLQTADRNELECLAEKGIQSYQCGFADEKQPRQLQESDKLRPFMTLDRQLYLIPGLFLEPALTQRYNEEPANKPRGELKRFTAKCTIKVIGELGGVKLRWSLGGTWEPAKKYSVATVSNCKIDG